MTFSKNNFYFVFFLVFMTACLYMGLGPCILGGFISYWLIVSVDHQLYKTKKLSPQLRTVWSLLIVSVIIGLMGVFLFKSIGSIVRENKVEQMLHSIILILEDSRTWLPQNIWDLIPKDVLALKNVLIELLRKHTDLIATYGKGFFKFVGLTLVGLIIGIIFSFNKKLLPHIQKDLASGESILKEGDTSLIPSPVSDAQLLKNHIKSFANSFKIIIFSQFWVAIFNTGASILYLSVLLPLFDVHVPYRNVAIIITFCASLIPILGNLISNTLIVLLSLTVSLKVAICSLFYLMFIHKFEYLIVARVFGGQIQCKIWEILCAIIFMEALFGITGLIMAPVIYTFIKLHLINVGFFGDNPPAETLEVPSYTESKENIEDKKAAYIEVKTNSPENKE